MKRALRILGLFTAVALGSPVITFAPAAAVNLDDSVRTCLTRTVGAQQAQRIATAGRLTATQRRQLASCRRASGGSGPTSTAVVVWSRGRTRDACETAVVDWTGERAAVDVLALASRGRAFRSLRTLIVNQDSHQLLPSCAHAVAAESRRRPMGDVPCGGGVSGLTPASLTAS